jgi:hypothetical protein
LQTYERDCLQHEQINNGDEGPLAPRIVPIIVPVLDILCEDDTLNQRLQEAIEQNSNGDVTVCRIRVIHEKEPASRLWERGLTLLSLGLIVKRAEYNLFEF